VVELSEIPDYKRHETGDPRETYRFVPFVPFAAFARPGYAARAGVVQTLPGWQIRPLNGMLSRERESWAGPWSTLAATGRRGPGMYPGQNL